ncbi:hypothetical protein ATANTOWER_001927 [Ataeniobius toweri]|uniref:Uncharacterized protein n=1 Tax=Ataeniobius toweri TaxID=208326 RepID=A0ABU7B4L8_9TELE|nr:hypothetical protein [Ataeniobius toweri]
MEKRQTSPQQPWDAVYMPAGCLGNMAGKACHVLFYHHKHMFKGSGAKKDEKHLILIVMYGGGSVILWASFSSKWPVRVHGIITFLKNLDNLDKALVDNARIEKIGHYWTG